MRVNRGLLSWGVFFVVLGAVPLAVRYGELEPGLLDDLWRLWPLILVGIGLGLVLRLTPLSWLGGALVAATFGLMFGAFLAGGTPGISLACVGTGAGETASRNGLVGGDRFELGLELTCGEVRVSRAQEARWQVQATHAVGRPPTIDGSSTGLSIRQPVESGAIFPFTNQARVAWDVRVPAAPALSLDLALNAASGDLILGPGPVASIGATFNASDAEVDLSAATTPEQASLSMTFNAASGTLTLPALSVSGGITLNASSLTLCIDPDAALRIEHKGTLSSDDLSGAGLDEAGQGWQTPGFAAAAQRIELRISSTVSSIDLDRSGGCR